MSSLEDAAAARKEKLLALRKRKAEGASIAEGAQAATETEPEAKVARTEFKFRSYDPSTGQARRHVKAVDEAETVESATRDVIREALQADEERRKQELDLFNIQPKKPNWDLRRDLDKRLEKLKPKTQAAINTLIRQRLGQAKGKSGTQASAGGEDMAEAVGRRTIDEEEGAMSDEDAL